jgi:glycosyltransferase involved in cell wall biosynthesis
MSGRNPPEMSVVVVTPDRYETVRKTVRHLKAQNVKDRLEIVLVAPAVAELGLDVSELKNFLQFRVVEAGPINSTARARAIGIRHTSAPIVALVEDHCFPAPGWAEAIINAHKAGWAAVGPVMANANPDGIISWANLLIEYSPWLEPAKGGTVDHLPGHNGSYKRDVLLNYGDQLEAMLEAESVLQWDLRAKGHRLYLESKARTFHQNFSTPLSSIPLRFHGGRLFASARARHWPLWQRVLYTAASPFIPLVRLWRIVGQLRRSGRPSHLLPRVLPALIAGLIFDGVGELVGYAFGPGNAMARLSDMEFHRYRYLAKMDKRRQSAYKSAVAP